ncbi:MgtC/SapB family protein [Mesorhizobium sp. M1088]|uniref:MgtC/SapB family protein n=1 Tax=Mesorhizobium sp. M1088 TaxID=2957056 RepID=UPI003338E949
MANRPAGLRTHIVVCVAAATFGILTMGNRSRADISAGFRKGRSDWRRRSGHWRRVPAAGSILFSRGEIHGLTTGAGLWLSGAIGVACGLGLWQVAALGTLLVLVAAGLLYNFHPSLALAKIPYQGSQCREKKFQAAQKLRTEANT